MKALLMPGFSRRVARVLPAVLGKEIGKCWDAHEAGAMLTIATSRYAAREKVVASGLAPVRTTVGHPRVRLGYEPWDAAYSSTTRFGTQKAQASSTRSRISSASMAARRTWAQW